MQAALLAAQLAAQENRFAQIVAMPARTSDGSTSAGSGEADFVNRSGLSDLLACLAEQAAIPEDSGGGVEQAPWSL